MVTRRRRHVKSKRRVAKIRDTKIRAKRKHTRKLIRGGDPCIRGDDDYDEDACKKRGEIFGFIHDILIEKGTQIHDILLNIFNELWTSIKEKDIHTKYMELNNTLFYNKFYSPEQFENTNIGLEDLKKKFEDLKIKVMTKNLFDTIHDSDKMLNTQKNWIKLFEVLIGFDNEYQKLFPLHSALIGKSICEKIKSQYDANLLTEYCEKISVEDKKIFPYMLCVKHDKETESNEAIPIASRAPVVSIKPRKRSTFLSRFSSKRETKDISELN